MPFRRRSNPGRSWQVNVSHKGLRAFKTLPGTMTPREVQEFEARLKFELSMQPRKMALPRNVVVLRNATTLEGDPPDDIVKKLHLATRRVKSKNTPTGLSEDDVRALLRRAQGRCEVSGIPLVYGKPVGFRRNPYAPTIDRIDSRLGYSPTNCRVVNLAVNLALNNWGDAVFHEIAMGYAKRPFKVKAG